MEDINDLDEHDVREQIEKHAIGEIMSFYNENNDTWDISIHNGEYNFIGKVSNNGIPTSGTIEHNGEFVYFENNKQLLNNNFKDTIIGLYQDGINKMFQEEANNNAFLYYTKDCEIIPEQPGESGSEDEEQNVIHEEPTPLTQQHQTQPNLSLQSGQNQGFGLGGDN